MLKYFDWDEEKDKRLESERDVCFEDIQIAIDEGRILDDIGHPNKKRYPNQRMLIVEIKKYAYFVPYVEDEEKIFFKTVIPSRKATKKYLIDKGR